MALKENYSKVRLIPLCSLLCRRLKNQGQERHFVSTNAGRVTKIECFKFVSHIIFCNFSVNIWCIIYICILVHLDRFELYCKTMIDDFCMQTKTTLLFLVAKKEWKLDWLGSLDCMIPLSILITLYRVSSFYTHYKYHIKCIFGQMILLHHFVLHESLLASFKFFSSLYSRSNF